MNLTEQILEIMIPMQIAFSQARSFKKFIEVIFAILCTAGRHTITSFIFFLQGEHKDWTHMYRFFSKQKWDPDVCFDVLAESALRKVLQKHNDIKTILKKDFIAKDLSSYLQQFKQCLVKTQTEETQILLSNKLNVHSPDFLFDFNK